MFENIYIPSRTLHDQTTGEPFAVLLEDGSYLRPAPPYASTLCWEDDVAEKVRYEVTWHGGKLRGDRSHTKGELLGDYARLPYLYRWVAAVGPRFAIASQSWYRLRTHEGS